MSRARTRAGVAQARGHVLAGCCPNPSEPASACHPGVALALAALGPLVLLVACVASPRLASDTESPHDYLTVDRGRLESHHALAYVLELPERFEPRDDIDYAPIWNDIPFRVSVAIFESDDEVVEVFAETLPAGMGRLDYSALPDATLAGLPFNLRQRCFDLRDLSEEEIVTVPPHVTLRAMGLDDIALVQQQYFVTSEDGLAELGLSYETKVASCDGVTDELRRELSRRAETEVFARLTRRQAR